MAAVMKNTVTIVRKATIGFSEVESKVIGATTNAPRDGIPCVDITTRAEIASMSLDGDAFDEISHILLQRLKDRSKWRRVLKALIVLHYCLQEGSPKFEAFCRFNLDLLKHLETFEYTWHENCDCGLFIRREAREIMTLLNDPSNLGNIHRHSASVRKKKSLSKSGTRKVVVPRDKARSQRSPTFTLDMLRAAFKRNNLNRGNSLKKASDTISIAESELNCAPVTMRQKVRHALLEDEVFGEMMISEIKEIASGMNKVHDFKDILEALVECTNVAHKDWDCVLKALLLLQSCFCNVYGEVESHFSDRPDLLKDLFEHGPWANGMSLAPGVSVEVEAIPTESLEEGAVTTDDPILDPFPFNIGRPEERSSGDLKRADLVGPLPEEPVQDSPPTYNSVSQVTTEPAAEIGAEPLSSADNEAVMSNLDRKILSEGSSEYNISPPEPTRFSRWSSRFLPQGQIDWTRLTRFNIRQAEPTSDIVSELQSVLKPESSSLGVYDSRPLPPIPVSEVAGESPPTETPPPYASGDAPPSPINEPPMYETLSTRGAVESCDSVAVDEELEYEPDPVVTPSTTQIVESPLSMQEELPGLGIRETALEEIQPTSRSASEDTPLEISLEMIRRDSQPVAGGGFGDVFTGQLLLPSGSVERVAVKVPRAVRLDLQNPRNVARLANRVLREMRIWGRLHHQNIVPLRGYCIEANGTPNLISPWFEHGNVTSYIASNPDGVSRFDVMKQMARGLLYLHSQDPPVAHGDLKAANVLVDGDGNIALTDFGLSKILEETSSSSLSLSTEGFVGSIRWCAPERLLSETSERTLAGDIWSFGCLCLEIFSGRIPYATILNDGCVISHIIMGKLPSRTDYPMIMDDDALWSFLYACWKENPAERPLTQELLNMIERMEAESQGRFAHVSE